jgi:hypothetical protein
MAGRRPHLRAINEVVGLSHKRTQGSERYAGARGRTIRARANRGFVTQDSPGSIWDAGRQARSRPQPDHRGRGYRRFEVLAIYGKPHIICLVIYRIGTHAAHASDFANLFIVQ